MAYADLVMSEDPVVYLTNRDTARVGTITSTTNTSLGAENSPHSTDGSVYSTGAADANSGVYANTVRALTNTMDITMSFWVRAQTANNSSKTLVSMFAGTEWYFTIIVGATNNLLFRKRYNYSNNLETRINLDDTNWHHVVIRFTKTGNVVEAFHNGVRTLSTYDIQNLPSSLSQVRVLSQRTTLFTPVNGWVDEFAVYDKAVSDEFIQQLYAGPPLNPFTIWENGIETPIALKGAWNGTAIEPVTLDTIV